MEATVLSLAKAVLDVALTTAKSAVAGEVALQLGVERELSFIKDEFEMMKTFLMSADEEERIHNKVVKAWVKQVRDLAYDVEDCLQDFTVHSEKPPPYSSCGRFSTARLVARRRIAADLRKLKARVDDVSQRNLRYRLAEYSSGTTELERTGDAAMFGFGIHEARRSARQDDKQKVDLGQLITDSEQDLRVVSVWGTNGDLGKTTIIREAYDDPQVYGKFQCRGWVKPTHPFSPNDFFHSLMRQFYEHQAPPPVKGFDVLRKLDAATAGGKLAHEFESHVNSRSYLIVINDLLSIEEWDWIKTYLPDKKKGSRVIVSTQQLELASLCTEQPHQVSELKQLSSEQALYLFYKKVSGPIRLQTTQVKLEPTFSTSNATDHRSSQIMPQDDEDDISVGIGGSLLRKHKFKSAVKKPLTLTWTMAAVASHESQLIGRDREKREVAQLITNDGEHRQVISVWGMGGLGKTTLVRSVYQSQDLSGMFHKRAWVTVHRSFSPKEIFRSLVLQLHADSSGKETNVFSMLGGGLQKNSAMMGTEELIQESIRLLKGCKYLIVFDDMASIAECDLILPFLPEEKNASRIIVTTREETVATHHSREYKLRPLEDQAAIDLFKNKVFKDQAKIFHLNPDMIEEGKLIIKKCGGLPLAIATIGGFLSTRPKSTMEWRNLNDHISAELHNNLSFEKIRTILTSSYEGLPYHLKPCFLYMSIFPEDRDIRRGRLVRRWIAEGYSREMRGLTADEVGEKQFTDLINRSMIQPSRIVGNKIYSCKVHDLMREVSVSKSEEENVVHVLEENCTMHSRDKMRHLVVSSSWSRENRNALESMMDVSHIRSLTVFGEWRSFLISKKMRLLRVLDLEGTSGLQDRDLVPIGKLYHLNYLSLRGTIGVFNLPDSFGNLCNLETLDIRDTFVIKLPRNIVKLEKLKYLRAGLIPDDEMDSRAEVAEFFRRCCSVIYKMCIGDGPNDEADKMFRSNFAPLLGIVFDLVLRGLDPYGVRVPRGIGKLKALHTLGVVNVARGNAMLKELKKLTHLRKLGVAGINKNNCKDVCAAIANHGHLLSLTMRAEGEHGLESCLDDLSTPPKDLQSLKFYGNLVMLPSWIEQLQNLAKLTLRSTKLELDATLLVLGKLPSLAILRLRERSCKVGVLQFHFHREAFSSLIILELDTLWYLKSVKFEEAAMPKLEQLQVHHCRHMDNFGLSGLDFLQTLREVSVKGSCNGTLKDDLQEQLAKNRNKPNLKIED